MSADALKNTLRSVGRTLILGDMTYSLSIKAARESWHQPRYATLCMGGFPDGEASG
jgi:hypothetical protein